MAAILKFKMAAIKPIRKNGTNPSFVLLVLSIQKNIGSKNVSKIFATLHNNLHYIEEPVFAGNSLYFVGIDARSTMDNLKVSLNIFLLPTKLCYVPECTLTEYICRVMLLQLCWAPKHANFVYCNVTGK